MSQAIETDDIERNGLTFRYEKFRTWVRATLLDTEGRTTPESESLVVGGVEEDAEVFGGLADKIASRVPANGQICVQVRK